MAYTADKVIKIALNEVGYLEKKSNSQLDNKTANAGRNNYTKYARDLDNISGFYNGKKNGYPWCDVFCDWCFVKAFGVSKAKELLCQPSQSLGAGCGYSARYYKDKGQFYAKNPKIGDQIFFLESNMRDVAHTGLVYDVDSTYVYTVEGNTSSSSGVVDNGGAVEKKKYKLSYNRIYGYGRPNYDSKPAANTSTSTSTNTNNAGGNTTDKVYVVKIHDTLSKIAERYGTTYQALAAYNNISNPNIIRVGQEIRIPTSATVAPSYAEWTGYVNTKNSNLNVRSSASSKNSSNIIGSLAKGSSVKVVGEDGDWYKISYNNRTAYVSKGYISKAKPATTPVFKAYNVKVTAKSGLNIRKNANVLSGKIGALSYGTIVTVSKESGKWGYIANKGGWISLEYTIKV